MGGEDVGGGVAGGDEGEGEVAFHRVGDADDAGFSDGGVGEDGLFDCACCGVCKLAGTFFGVVFVRLGWG